MTPLRVAIAFIAAGLFAIAALVVIPIAMEADVLLKSEDDPAMLADRALAGKFDEAYAVKEIEAALVANDADLASSFLELARERSVAIPDALAAKVKVAVEAANSTAAHVESFARGLVTGEPDNMVGLAGTALGDLFVFGDIRDMVREGSRYVSGQPADELVLGLSAVGLAITAGTYASVGAAGPARIGLSAVKAARRTGKIGAGMAAWISRSLREVIDWSALKRAGAAIASPTTALREARTVVKAEKADGLMKLASDVGRVQTKAGTQAALDGLKLAEGPRDMARIAKLAEKKGGKTRAILKTLGRGAILLSLATFNLASWILAAILMLWGFVSSTKSGVERMTQRSLDRAKVRKRELAMMEQQA
jgi:hypothetical protein